MKSFIALMAVLMCSVAQAGDNIVIVFDTSGSMENIMRPVNKTRMAVAKECLIDVLGKLPPTTKVGILTFNSWVYEMDYVDQTKLKNSITTCRSEGSTPLYRHISAAATRLLQERAKQNNVGSYKLIVVTDGEADRDDVVFNSDTTWNDGAPKLGVIKDIISRGIVIDTIGLDLRGDHALKSQINGTYMRGDDPTSITQSLSKAVAEISLNGKDAANEGFFKELNELPDVFVKSTIQGLTELPNHPIGERAPVYVIKDGAVVEQANPDSPDGWSCWQILLVGIGGFFVFCGGLAVYKKLNGDF